MQFELDPATGNVTLTLAAFQELVTAKQPPAYSPVFVLDVESDSRPGKRHKVIIWFDADGVMQGYCPCEDHTFRGNWCKHLGRASAARLCSLS